LARNLKTNREYIMKISSLFIASIMAISLLIGVSCNTAIAEDDEANFVKELLENDKVVVTESRRHPGTIFEACKVKFTFPDGKSVVKEIPAGKVIWSDGCTHEVEVLGNTDFHVLHVEIE
jgi:hypothetical protein